MQAERLNKIFAALADPTRRAILARLASGEAAVTELAEPFDMSLPAVSKHLKVLERAGLITRTRSGQWRRCRLEAGPLRDATEWLDGYRRFWEGGFDRLDDHLRTIQRKADAMTDTPSGPLAHSNISITRTFDAPRELVFKAWTEPEHFTHWFSAPPATISMDVRPGGRFRATMVAEGMEVPFAGVYREVVAPERLVFTLVDANEPELLAEPEQAANPEVVTVVFRELDGKTEMVFQQVGHLPADEAPQAEEGWGLMFDAFAAHLAKVGS